MPEATTVERRSPSKFRAYAPKGLKAGQIDRENRVILGYAVITRGEALGHYVWIDGEMLDQVVAAGNAKPNGAKSRFTHPGLCSDGLGKYLGRSKNFRRDGDIVRADLHFAKVASKSPEMESDPVEYLLDLAEEDPAAFASSIVYWPDWGAEDRFVAEHENEDGNFISPDADNKKNLPHARMSKLDAVDVVDEPAANPGGFFSAGEERAVIAEQTLSWIFGLSDVAPSSEALGGGQPDRIREFVSGFMARHGITFAVNESITEKENPMPEQNNPDPMLAAREQFAANLKTLKDAFPTDQAFAVACAADGLSVEQARAKYSIVLEEKLTASNARLAELEKSQAALKAENQQIKQQLLDGSDPKKPGPGAMANDNVIEKARAYQSEHKCDFATAFRAVNEASKK